MSVIVHRCCFTLYGQVKNEVPPLRSWTFQESA